MTHWEHESIATLNIGQARTLGRFSADVLLMNKATSCSRQKVMICENQEERVKWYMEAGTTGHWPLAHHTPRVLRARRRQRCAAHPDHGGSHAASGCKLGKWARAATPASESATVSGKKWAETGHERKWLDGSPSSRSRLSCPPCQSSSALRKWHGELSSSRNS